MSRMTQICAVLFLAFGFAASALYADLCMTVQHSRLKSLNAEEVVFETGLNTQQTQAITETSGNMG